MNKEDLIQIIRDGATLEQTHKIIDYIEQLQNNWNELKKCLEERAKRNDELILFRLCISSVLSKMEHIEKGIEEDEVELKFEKLEKESDVK